MRQADEVLSRRPPLPEHSPSRSEYVDLMGYADDLEDTLRELLRRWDDLLAAARRVAAAPPTHADLRDAQLMLRDVVEGRSSE